jgi:hypothetical protein
MNDIEITTMIMNNDAQYLDCGLRIRRFRYRLNV